jgi:hypothetical protein
MAGPFLSIAGVSDVDGAWMIITPERVESPPPKRRTNTLMPEVDGKRGNPGWNDEHSLSLDMLFMGDNDHAGDPHADPLTGLLDNLRWYDTNVVNAEEDDRGTVEAVYTYRDGTTATFRIQVDELQWGDGSPDKPCTLRVVLPDGRIPAGT